MENKEKQQISHIESYLLEGDGETGWLQYSWAGKYGGYPAHVERLWGKTWIKHDTLIMGVWKVNSPVDKDEPQTLDALKQIMSSTPKWNKTKYYMKIADIGWSGLRVCETGEEAPEAIADEILPKLGFVKEAKGVKENVSRHKIQNRVR